jgi:hypothetical protein
MAARTGLVAERSPAVPIGRMTRVTDGGRTAQ